MHPLVSVIITTYNRTEIARRTLEGLINHLMYPEIQWILADDGSEAGHLSTLLDVFPANASVFVTQADRGGVGKSKNLALQRAFENSPYVLLMEDDWLLDQTLDLTPHVLTLQEYENAGIIRFGYLGAMPHENFTAIYRDYGNFKSYWELVAASAMYVYSGQVSLRHKRWYDVVGYHAEGIQAGQEEEDMCRRYNDKYGPSELFRLISTASSMAASWGVRDITQALNTAKKIAEAHYVQEQPMKILWPGEYGCVLNKSPFKNIGMDNSTNAVQP